MEKESISSTEWEKIEWKHSSMIHLCEKYPINVDSCLYKNRKKSMRTWEIVFWLFSLHIFIVKQKKKLPKFLLSFFFIIVFSFADTIYLRVMRLDKFYIDHRTLRIMKLMKIGAMIQPFLVTRTHQKRWDKKKIIWTKSKCNNNHLFRLVLLYDGNRERKKE